MKKLLVVGMIILLVGMSVPSTVTSDVEQSTVIIFNDYHKNADCYLVTDNMRQGTFGNPGFSVNANDDAIIVINEDDLMFQRGSYNIKLVVTIDDVPIESVAYAVTESADFIIENGDGQIDIFKVNCIGYQ